jgi:hypothetical protein
MSILKKIKIFYRYKTAVKNASRQMVPFYQRVWAEQTLPLVFYARYANRLYTTDRVTVSGIMSIHYNTFYQFLAPLFRIMGSLVPYAAENIAVTVKFYSDPRSEKILFNRTFTFSERKPYVFNSYLQPVKDNIVVEFMKYNIGWRCRYIHEGNYIRMEHAGYVFKCFNVFIPLPLRFLIGTAYAEEEAISDTAFRMLLKMHHPWFGEFFNYHGQFKIVEVECADKS